MSRSYNTDASIVAITCSVFVTFGPFSNKPANKIPITASYGLCNACVRVCMVCMYLKIRKCGVWCMRCVESRSYQVDCVLDPQAELPSLEWLNDHVPDCRSARVCVCVCYVCMCESVVRGRERG